MVEWRRGKVTRKMNVESPSHRRVLSCNLFCLGLIYILCYATVLCFLFPVAFYMRHSNCVEGAFRKLRFLNLLQYSYMAASQSLTLTLFMTKPSTNGNFAKFNLPRKAKKNHSALEIRNNFHLQLTFMSKTNKCDLAKFRSKQHWKTLWLKWTSRSYPPKQPSHSTVSPSPPRSTFSRKMIFCLRIPTSGKRRRRTRKEKIFLI